MKQWYALYVARLSIFLRIVYKSLIKKSVVKWTGIEMVLLHKIQLNFKRCWSRENNTSVPKHAAAENDPLSVLNKIKILGNAVNNRLTYDDQVSLLPTGVTVFPECISNYIHHEDSTVCWTANKKESLTRTART